MELPAAPRLKALTDAATGSHAEAAAGIAAQLAPPLQRTPLAARPWGDLNPLRRLVRRVPLQRSGPAQRPAGDAAAAPRAVVPAARRALFGALVCVPTAGASVLMHTALLGTQASWPLHAALLALFSALLAWISAGFWTAMMGFVTAARGGDRYLISRAAAATGRLDPAARTAVVMPICNEDVARVFAGLRATYESLAATGELAAFDFYVLSDSSEPDLRVAELDAWRRLCRSTAGFGRIFYRRRSRRVKRKSGNIDDFLRRWGSGYRYLVVLDADSVMSGACLTTLVRLMQARPDAGIIQTAPRASGRDTLYARVQQFAGRVYGPLFTAGMHYWQLDESHYWGHNAIIRVAPFMQHCLLAPLPGNGSLAGEILSHDFVEAALMRRAGWGVWVAHDLEGSHEELPPNLLAEVGRDRRWCHGNLMNARLIGAAGIRPVHRVVFLTGVLAYASSLLWALFILLSAVLLFSQGSAPTAPWTAPTSAGALLAGIVLTLLLAPKLLALALILQRGAGEYGGAARVTASVVLESLLSALLAPTRMLFHARFVLAALGGWRIQWRSPPRDDAATTWRDAWRHQRGHLLIGALVLAPPVVHGLAAGIWVLPVGLALLLGIAASVWTSSVAAGRIARAAQLFVVPEESRVPDELRLLRRYLRLQPVAAGILALRHDAELRGLLVAASRRRGSTVPRVLLAGDPRLWSAAQRTALLDSPALMAQWLAAADTTRGLPSRVASAAAPPLIAASSAAPLGAGVAMAAG